MLFGFDYDGTWSAAPGLFAEFADMVKAYGHQCVCVTFRAKDTKDALLENSIGQHMGIIYTDGNPKADAAHQAGYTVDIWIDDIPSRIGDLSEPLPDDMC